MTSHSDDHQISDHNALKQPESVTKAPVMDKIKLAGIDVHISIMADYLGLRVHSSRGLICKDVELLKAKGCAALYMMTGEKWFSLQLQPKRISNLYETHVRSTLLYGTEILTVVEQRPVAVFDDELTRRFLKSILKLKSIDMQPKHRKRLLLVLRIPKLEMEIEYRCRNRVESRLERSKHDTPKIAARESQLLEDISSLQPDQPLNTALGQVKSGVSDADLKASQWKKLEQESVGANSSKSRHIKSERKVGHREIHTFPKFLRDPKLTPPMKRAMLRWSVYRFPVRYKPTSEEARTLHQITNTDDLGDEEYMNFVEQIRLIFNAEQELWIYGNYIAAT